MTFSNLAPETREALWRLARERLDAKDVDGTGMHVTLQAPLPGGAEVPVRFPVLTFADGAHALGESVIVEPKAYTMGVDFGAGYRQEYPALSEMRWIQPGDKLKFSGAGIFNVTGVSGRSLTFKTLEDAMHKMRLREEQAREALAFGNPGGFLPDPGARPFPKTRAPFKRAEPKP